jgi:hypothetical protein
VEQSKADPDFTWGGFAWSDITGIGGDPSTYPWAGESLDTWWKKGPSRFEERFGQLAAQWRTWRATGETTLSRRTTSFDPVWPQVRVSETRTKLGVCYYSLKALGITTLPLIMKLLRAGDYDFLWLARAETDGESGVVDLRKKDPYKSAAEETLAWWETNKAHWTIPWPTAAPPPGP